MKTKITLTIETTIWNQIRKKAIDKSQKYSTYIENLLKEDIKGV